MLASAETISVVAETLRGWQEKTGKELKIVLDPVRSPLFIIWHLLVLPRSNNTGRLWLQHQEPNYSLVMLSGISANYCFL